MCKRVSLCGVVCFVALAVHSACGSPSTPTPQNSCRVYPTNYTTSSISGVDGSTTISAYTCGFDRPSAFFNCSIVTSNSGSAQQPGFAYTQTLATTYLSVDDVVDEVSVVPPLVRYTGTILTSSGVVTNTANSFDSRKRLIRTTTLSGGVTAAVDYTAWDSKGRYTAANTATTGGPVTLTYSYDDTARTMTQIPSTGNSVITSFDADGNPTRYVTTGSTGTTTINVNVVATQTICR